MSATLRCQEGILKFEMNLKQKVLLLLSLQTEGSKTSEWKMSTSIPTIFIVHEPYQLLQ